MYEQTPSALQVTAIALLFASGCVSIYQCYNQYRHYKIKESIQRYICLLSSMVTFVFVTMCLAYAIVYPIELANGLTISGKLGPLKSTVLDMVVGILTLLIAYAGIYTSIQASLYRYHRLCKVQRGTMPERLFIVGKHGALVATVIGFLAHACNVYLVLSSYLLVIQVLGFFWLFGMDFILSMFMIYRAFKVVSAGPAIILRAQALLQQAHKIRTKRNLIVSWSLIILVNTGCFLTFSLAETYYLRYYIELYMICGAGLNMFLCLKCMIVHSHTLRSSSSS